MLQTVSRRLFSVAALLLAALIMGAGAARADGGDDGDGNGNGNGDDGNGATLFVSQSRGNDANPCTEEAPCKTIMRAVAAAAPGSRIVVLRGTYHELVRVTKQLTLIGRDATVDATGLTLPPPDTDAAIAFLGPGTAGSSISGFTAQNAIGEGILAFSTSHMTIAHNVVQFNDVGTNTPVTLQCVPQGPVPGDCGEAVHLLSTSYSRLVGNLVQNNHAGGFLITDEFGPSHGNVLAGNVSRDNGIDCGITLPSHNRLAVADPSKGGVYDNLVIGNVSKGNGGAGVGFFAGPPGAASYTNRAIGNILVDNGEPGAAIHSHTPGQNVSGNVIANNYISGNGPDPDAGSTAPTGIALLTIQPQTATISGNWIANEFWGIFITGPWTVNGLSSNHYASSVTHPTN
jgi:nitrous oxidase accessory protein NosD